MGRLDELQGVLALLPEGGNPGPRPADEHELARCAWDASGDVHPDVAVAYLLHHREPSDADAGKLAGRALDVPELAVRLPLDAAVHQQEAQAELGVLAP